MCVNRCNQTILILKVGSSNKLCELSALDFPFNFLQFPAISIHYLMMHLDIKICNQYNYISF